MHITFFTVYLNYYFLFESDNQKKEQKKNSVAQENEDEDVDG